MTDEKKKRNWIKWWNRPKRSIVADGIFVLPIQEIKKLRRLLLTYKALLLLSVVALAVWVGSLRDRLIEAEARAIIIMDHISMKKYNVTGFQSGESFYLVFNRKVEEMGSAINYNILHPEKGQAYAAEPEP